MAGRFVLSRGAKQELQIVLLIALVVLLVATNCSTRRLWIPEDLADDGPHQDLEQEAINDNRVTDGLFVGLRRAQQREYPFERRRIHHSLFKDNNQGGRKRRLARELAMVEPLWMDAYNESFADDIEVRTRRGEGGQLVDNQLFPLTYFVAPSSGQLIPIVRDDDKLPVAQNYVGGPKSNSIAVGWRPTVDNYKFELGRLGQTEAASGGQAGGASGAALVGLGGDDYSGECQTVRTSIRLTKDDLDKKSGKVWRSCGGLVQLNKCEGSCLSSVQPSVKSRSGFKKQCSCCNEAAFRRITVRLGECELAKDFYLQSNAIGLAGAAKAPELSGQALAAEEEPLTGSRRPAGSMEVEVEEPIECKCRRCDSSV